MSTLHFATNSIAATKEISHGGRRYLVSPVVALREGVLNGVYVSAAEFSKYAGAWAGRACPIGHPKNEGGYISANSPDVWANDVPGHLWNVEADGDKLKGEIWIDLEKAERMGERALGIVNRLRANQPVEVSTGYFADHDAVSGVWNGQPYLGVARNIRPDHLALLPDEVGACSWADGCGTPRVNQQESDIVSPPAQACLATNLTKEGETSMEEPCAQEIGLFEKFLGWMGQRKADSPLSPGATVPTANPVSNQEVETMSKQELIAGLTANQKCRFSKEKLESWDEADLTALKESLATNEEEPESSGVAGSQSAVQSPQSTALPSEITQFAEMIRGLGGLDKLAAALGGVTANVERERSDLIAGIMANSKATWSEAQLRALDTPTLHNVHGMALPRDYSGNGGYVRANDPEEEAMPMPWPDEFKKLGV